MDMNLIDNLFFIPKYSISPFKLRLGELALLFMPNGNDIMVCKRNIELFPSIKCQPYWVKFIVENIGDEEIKLINDNITYLQPFFSMKISSNYQFSRQEILSGWDIRLINLFILRKRGIHFFELNTAGLSTTSIRLMFNFLLQEIKESNHCISYLLIEPNINNNNNNPIFITHKNVDSIYDIIY
jgi:hypothetical protein